MRLAKFNPFNSLFGRVFVWFWTALLVILVSAFFLTKQLTDVLEVNAVSEKQEMEAGATIQRLSKVLLRSSNLHQSLRRLGKRNGLQIVAINTKTEQLRTSFPGPLAGNVNELKAFVESDAPLLIRLNNMEFVGPYSLSFKQEEYEVYVGRLLMRSERNVMSRSKVATAGLVLAIFLSTVFCFVLVLSITKPLGALRSASNRLAKGDLTTRIQGLESRKDEIGHLANDFNTMASRLQSLIDGQKTLMANVSHELRTPLTRLQLAVALLEGQLSTESDNTSRDLNEKHLARIESEIIKMDQMIGQVLTLAKINASQQSIDLQEVSLSSLLKDVLHDASFEAEALRKKLTISAIPDLVIHADMRLLISAVENILRNAIRFAKKEVSCEFNITLCELAANESTSGKFSTECIEIKITDDGLGMTGIELDTVFDPFFRGSHQVHEVSKGAGLGLSIAKAAIEMHGGQIFAQARDIKLAEASPLSGLSVIIQLPIVRKST
ncbi:ATP-binding protein [Brumicola nitratireducens]|uniref:histidine kinase n=1 Tax=Glaciecola nitratireducens (strain JCM 12485 / KCTC 12276 / FR1064) TaxID=1085623 RepID=G4QFL8_GLANF|nr:ATP-binding protein [Glaciecola nitratireducens]AEP28643.1 signal transduction histidine kinase [Glaciecola nitratireducens FR1064]